MQAATVSTDQQRATKTPAQAAYSGERQVGLGLAALGSRAT